MILNLRGLLFSQEIGSTAIMTREEDLCRLVCTDNHKIENNISTGPSFELSSFVIRHTCCPMLGRIA